MPETKYIESTNPEPKFAIRCPSVRLHFIFINQNLILYTRKNPWTLLETDKPSEDEREDVLSYEVNNVQVHQVEAFASRALRVLKAQYVQLIASHAIVNEVIDQSCYDQTLFYLARCSSGDQVDLNIAPEIKTLRMTPRVTAFLMQDRPFQIIEPKKLARGSGVAGYKPSEDCPPELTVYPPHARPVLAIR